MGLDIPTAVSPREVRFMQRICRDKSVVEFGALLGFSTITLAEVAGALTSIDRHNGYSGPTLNQLISNLDRHGVSGAVRIIEGDALQWSKRIGADIAFIDLTGEYDLTKGVLNELRSGCALVHDYGRPYCGGVERAIRDARYRIIAQVDTLVLCERTK